VWVRPEDIEIGWIGRPLELAALADVRAQGCRGRVDALKGVVAHLAMRWAPEGDADPVDCQTSQRGATWSSRLVQALDSY
jgi:hypothetical protein